MSFSNCCAQRLLLGTQASAAKAIKVSQMHNRSRTVSELIKEAHTECYALQGDLEAAEKAHDQATERLKSAEHSYDSLAELLTVAENARLISAAAARAHEACQNATAAAVEAEDAAACRREDICRLMAQRRLLEASGTPPEADDTLEST
jgi:chromosome segregation ATPase